MPGEDGRSRGPPRQTALRAAAQGEGAAGDSAGVRPHDERAGPRAERRASGCTVRGALRGEQTRAAGPAPVWRKTMGVAASPNRADSGGPRKSSPPRTSSIVYNVCVQNS